MFSLDKVFIVDIETDGFLEDLKKLHVLSCTYQDTNGKWQIKSTTKKEDIRKLFENPHNTIVGHFFLGFDLPALKLLFPDINFQANIIDTLGLSWYLYDEKRKHGLEEWGEFFGVPKPEIEDWENLTYEEYRHRCEEDTKINTNLWLKFLRELREIYNNDDSAIIRIIKYLNFKIECLKDQRDIKLRVDLDKIQEGFDFFLPLQEEKFKKLTTVLPKVPKKAVKSMPKKMYNKNGSLSSLGEKWFVFLEEQGLPLDTEGPVEYIKEYVEPNPKSPEQIKNWLYSLGWKPITFEARKNTAGEINEIPQVNLKGGELCPSVKRLVEVEPIVEELQGLGIIKHRLGLLKSFRECEEDGFVVSSATALTNTLRLKHKRPVANLPKVTKKKDIKDGYWIRGVIIAPEGYEICGSDMSSLEARVRDHFLWPYDPEYVKTMMAPGFDSHLDFCEQAGAMTKDEVLFYKWYDKNHG